MRRGVFTLVSALVGWTLCASVAQATQYKLTDLGLMEGFNCAEAEGISNSGDIIGTLNSESGTQAAFLIHNGEMSILSARPNTGDVHAYGVNSSGTVVGMDREEYSPYGCMWADGAFTKLETPYGPTIWANAINDAGQIAAVTGNINPHAVLYTPGDGWTDLGTNGYTYSWANAISSNGIVAGYLGTEEGGISGRAFMWQNGVMTDIHSIGTKSAAYGVNSSGVVVGGAFVDGYEHGFIYSNGVMTDIETYFEPASNVVSVVNGINDLGQAVGRSSRIGAFVYDNGTFTALDGLPDGILLSSCALAINNRGSIVGWALDGNGLQHAVLWEPVAVPEPASILALVTGLVGISGVAIRRRR